MFRKYCLYLRCGEMSNGAAPDDTYANGINIEELFEVAKEEDSRKLKEILTRKGFAVDDNQDERYDCDSEKWKKTVYNPERTDSDTISVYWTSATIYSGREVDIVVSCHKDEIMDGWVSVIRGLGYSIEDVYEEEDSKRMAYSKEDHRGSVIDYDLISNEKSINILTNLKREREISIIYIIIYIILIIKGELFFKNCHLSFVIEPEAFSF